MSSPSKPTDADVKKIYLDDPVKLEGKLKVIGGSPSDDWNNSLANEMVRTLWLAHSDAEGQQRQIQGAIAALIGIAPKDELEGMMAAQLIAAHSAAMECYRRGMIAEQTAEARRDNLNLANKLARAFTELLSAINKHRGKGQQKVTVEHVHVHSGAQAVVGVVETSGGGTRSKPEGYPDAKQITHAPEPALWGGDPQRKTVPLAGNEKRSLPHARRRLARSTEGE